MSARISNLSNRGHRGEPVIKDVFDATREELARVGFRALRIEDVAARANVNKTTIYRRWPNKSDLVQDALRSMFEDKSFAPNTGSLRGDLLMVAGAMLDFLRSANGQALVRMMMAEGTEDDLRRIVDTLRSEKEGVGELIIERAKARGEVRGDVKTELLLSTLVGGLHHRIFAICVATNEIDLEEHVDLLLYGAVPRATK
jgi:AcrR family transcriptional regulator